MKWAIIFFSIIFALIFFSVAEENIKRVKTKIYYKFHILKFHAEKKTQENSFLKIFVVIFFTYLKSHNFCSSLQDTDTDDMSFAPFVPATQIHATYGISPATLRLWANADKIRCIRSDSTSGKRFYSLPDVLKKLGRVSDLPAAAASHAVVEREKAKVCYARVSSEKQRPDLERQLARLAAAYPQHELLRDIASSLNCKRRGLLSLLERASRGEIQEVVVEHRDRLCRFSFDLYAWLFGKFGARLVVLGPPDTRSEGGVGGGEDELAEDLLAVANYFVAAHNGRRAAANRRARRAEHDSAEQPEKRSKHQASTATTTSSASHFATTSDHDGNTTASDEEISTSSDAGTSRTAH
jgi:predicted site-specific integrase-resolvase